MDIKSFNPNFGSRNLYKAELKRYFPIVSAKTNLPVCICELDIDDKERMSKELPRWEKTTFGEVIIDNFIDECKNMRKRSYLPLKKFFIAESKSFFGNSIKAMGEADIKEDYIQLSLLQSDTENKRIFPVKGAGSCILYAVSKLANIFKMNCIYIRASKDAINFYKKLGATCMKEETSPSGFGEFLFKKEDFPKFQREMEQKYSIEKTD